jgi:glycosyltransferase involved in cell wall biosynthesis
MMPTVSIVLPTFNRSTFLPAAIGSIAAQTYRDWELLIVDDGSTDDTEAVISGLSRSVDQPLQYMTRPNGGAYAARNTGLAASRGRLIAFFDSDDLWLPHHLDACVRALTDAPEVDWVYGACRTIDHATGRVLVPDTFRINGSPRPFMNMQESLHGPLHLLKVEGLVECALLDGLFCGLQNSVIRRSVFDHNAFHESLRNEAEDQLFVIRAITRGHRVGFLDDIHVDYHVHEANSSGSATGPMTVERRLRLLQPVVRGFEELRDELVLTAPERAALRRRLHRECFWHLGYSVYKASGVYSTALVWFRRGLREWPWSPRAWKTYVATCVQALLQ